GPWVVGEVVAAAPGPERDEQQRRGHQQRWTADPAHGRPCAPSPHHAAGNLAEAGDPRPQRNQALNGSSTNSAVTPPSPTETCSARSASRRTIARAIGPRAGERQAVPTAPTSFSPRRSESPCAAGALSRSPRSRRFGLPR